MRTQILYEDNSILVCRKPAGLAVETARIQEADMVTELKNYLPKNGGRPPYLGVIHRLDQPVEGIVLFALNESAARDLSLQLAQGRMTKIYNALVYGRIPENGEMSDLIYRTPDRGSAIAVPGKSTPAQLREAKKSFLSYRKLDEMTYEDGNVSSLAEIRLGTGRHHQIRVQFAHAGHPLLGDRRYGSEASAALSQSLGIRYVQLAACRLSFVHPVTRKPMDFETPVSFK